MARTLSPGFLEELHRGNSRFYAHSAPLKLIAASGTYAATGNLSGVAMGIEFNPPEFTQVLNTDAGNGMAMLIHGEEGFGVNRVHGQAALYKWCNNGITVVNHIQDCDFAPAGVQRHCWAGIGIGDYVDMDTAVWPCNSPLVMAIFNNFTSLYELWTSAGDGVNGAKVASTKGRDTGSPGDRMGIIWDPTLKVAQLTVNGRVYATQSTAANLPGSFDGTVNGGPILICARDLSAGTDVSVWHHSYDMRVYQHGYRKSSP